MSGFETAFGEITLVLFTTLAPSGAVAFILMGLPILTGHANVAQQRRIDQFLCVPLVVSLVGLVASATHLGNPSNALYVFAGVGRSPLSTEVFFAVVFLALAGVYWLYSFAEHPIRGLQRWWMACIVLAAVAFVTAVAFAYAADSILSWNVAWVPLNLWLNALVGGPILAVLGLRAAGYEPVFGSRGYALVLASGVALAANAVGYCLQGAQLSQLENSFVTAAELVPAWGLMVAVFAAACVVGIVLDVCFVSAKPATVRAVRFSLARAAIASISVFSGIFVMRFAFYMMHMTVGLGV